MWSALGSCLVVMVTSLCGLFERGMCRICFFMLLVFGSLSWVTPARMMAAMGCVLFVG